MEEPHDKEHSRAGEGEAAAAEEATESPENTKIQDHWKIEGEELVRVHVKPRTALFTPISAQCPLEVAELSVRRRTQVEFVNGKKELIGDDWTVRENANRALDAKWTGATIFHRDTSENNRPRAKKQPGDIEE